MIQFKNLSMRLFTSGKSSRNNAKPAKKEHASSVDCYSVVVNKEYADDVKRRVDAD